MNSLLMVAVHCITLLLIAIPAASMEAVVVIDHFPPWKTATDGEVGGIDVKLTNALFAEVGITPVYQICPWSRCLAMLKSGEAHFVTGLLKREDRKKFLIYIEPAYKDKSAKAFYKPAGDDDIRAFSDLKGLRIGTQRGAAYFPEFDNAICLKKHPVEKDEFNFRKLAQGRLDAVITTESQGDHIIATLGLHNKVHKASYRYKETIPVHFAVSRQSPLAAMLPKLNAATKKLRENGTFDAIIKGYFTKLTAGKE